MASKEAAPAGSAANAGKQGLPMGAILAVVILTVVGIGAGGVFGLQVLRKPAGADAAKTDHAPAHAAKQTSGGASVKQLAPIITNLLAPKNSWIRIEASIVLEGDPMKEEEPVAAKITEDVLAYLKTLTLAQIEGPSGFQHLREDLNDRVKTRTGGRVRELILHTMIIE